jgi:hypothetical protein
MTIYYQDFVKWLIECGSGGSAVRLPTGGTMLGAPNSYARRFDQDVRSLLLNWAKHDRFNVRKYLEFVEAASNGETAFCNVLEDCLYNGKHLILRCDWPGQNCWVYRLSENERQTALAAYRCAVEIIDSTCNIMREQSTLTTNKWLFVLLSLYFGGMDFNDHAGLEKELTDDPVRANRVKQAVLKKLDSVREGLVNRPQTVVLCRGEDKSGELLASAANATYEVKNGAMILLHDPFFTRKHLATQGMSIVHEASHLFAKTDDKIDEYGEVAYGRERCVKLPARSAMFNADSYALFAGDVHLGLTKRAYYEGLTKAVDQRNMIDDFPKINLPKFG